MVKHILEYLTITQSQFPDKPAFSDQTVSLTFGQLYDHCRSVATCLSKQIPPRTPVAVLANKSPFVVAAFMGVATAGCFYVHLDPSQPTARLNRILNTLKPGLLLYDEGAGLLLPGLTDTGTTISLESLFTHPQTKPDDSRLAAIHAQALDTDPLYAIFTSGSTGEPKGVLVCHRSVIDFIEPFTSLFQITPEDVIGNQAPFDFDVSVKDIYSAIKTGASVELIPKQLFSMPAALLDVLCDRKITTAIWAVSALCMITSLNGFSYRVPSHLNKILFSGEVMPDKHLRLWMQALPQAQFVNLYGPTEITCNCTYYMVDPHSLPAPLPIGKPFPNEGVMLLDEYDQAIGESHRVGELCVYGSSLALGYYNNIEKTKQAFVQNPCQNLYPQIIYRTGDLAHYGDDGLLYFDGRKDFQIKHMGHRIELGEIEAALEQAPGVLRAVCIFWQEKQKIVAFYVGASDKKEISSFLSTRLPAYMQPNRYRMIEAIPLTKNGKADRAALKEML